MRYFRKKNTTSNGEFVCSYFSWLNLNKQKENAERLSKITCDRKSKKYGCKVGCRYPGDGAAHHKRLS